MIKRREIRKGDLVRIKHGPVGKASGTGIVVELHKIRYIRTMTVMCFVKLIGGVHNGEVIRVLSTDLELVNENK